MRKQIYLAGGCFWGVEKYFSQLPGVTATKTGYANGFTENPTYRQVCEENTGHAETVQVEYDPDLICLPFLLFCYFRAIDPLSENRQGNDVGTQYRTGIYYQDEKDEPVILRSAQKLERSLGRPLAVEIGPLSRFDPAEEFHQKYLDKNPGGYCHIRPELFQWAKTARDDKGMRGHDLVQPLACVPRVRAMIHVDGFFFPEEDAKWSFRMEGVKKRATAR